MRQPVKDLPTPEICRVAMAEIVPHLERLAKNPGKNPQLLGGALKDAAGFIEELCKRIQETGAKVGE